MNYKSDKIFSNQQYFTYVHDLEVRQLIPLKNKLKYDELTNDERMILLKEYDTLKAKIDELNRVLKVRTNEPLYWKDLF